MIRADIVAEARKCLGVPYHWGGESPSGFDSMGLIKYVYKKVTGKTYPHFSLDMNNLGIEVANKDSLQLGDLVFPTRSHVGIYSGNGNFIHAPKKGDVVKEEKIYHFYTGRRLL